MLTALVPDPPSRGSTRRTRSAAGCRLSRRTPRVAALLFALLIPNALLISTAEASERRGVKPVQSLLEIRHDKVVRQQWDLSCGAAALATVLTYQHDDPVPERTIAETMLERTDAELVQARLGFSLLDLKRFVDARGYQGIGYAEVSLDDLVELGPAIVPVRITSFDHFVVFRGRMGDRVLLADPAWGNRIMHVATFAEVWRDHLAFVVERQGGDAPPDQLRARPADFGLAPPAARRAAILG